MRRRLAIAALGVALGSANLIGLVGGIQPATAVTNLNAPPPGANNWQCKSPASHPNPVVLVHGLGATMYANWFYLSPQLAARGYCVFALTYGVDPRLATFGAPGGTIPVQQSAHELAAFVARVLKATGARKVDLVGHSEGTFMPQYWLKFLGGATKVSKYIAMAPLYQGSTLYGLSEIRDLAAQYGLAGPVVGLISQYCGSCAQFLHGSPMQRKLVRGGIAARGVDYTTIMSKYDEAVKPYTSGYLPGAHNLVLQNVCSNDVSEHLAMAFDPVVAQIIFNALDPAHSQPVNCHELPLNP